jgi:hypothetical protein
MFGSGARRHPKEATEPPIHAFRYPVFRSDHVSDMATNRQLGFVNAAVSQRDVSGTRAAGRVVHCSGPFLGSYTARAAPRPGVLARRATVRAENRSLFIETEICDFRRNRARAACSAPPRKPRGATRQRAFGFETEL